MGALFSEVGAQCAPKFNTRGYKRVKNACGAKKKFYPKRNANGHCSLSIPWVTSRTPYQPFLKKKYFTTGA